MRAGAATSNALKAIEARPALVPPPPKPRPRMRTWGFRWKHWGWVLRVQLVHYRVGSRERPNH